MLADFIFTLRNCKIPCEVYCAQSLFHNSRLHPQEKWNFYAIDAFQILNRQVFKASNCFVDQVCFLVNLGVQGGTVILCMFLIGQHILLGISLRQETTFNNALDFYSRAWKYLQHYKDDWNFSESTEAVQSLLQGFEERDSTPHNVYERIRFDPRFSVI